MTTRGLLFCQTTKAGHETGDGASRGTFSMCPSASREGRVLLWGLEKKDPISSLVSRNDKEESRKSRKRPALVTICRRSIQEIRGKEQKCTNEAKKQRRQINSSMENWSNGAAIRAWDENYLISRMKACIFGLYFSYNAFETPIPSMLCSHWRSDTLVSVDESGINFPSTDAMGLQPGHFGKDGEKYLREDRRQNNACTQAPVLCQKFSDDGTKVNGLLEDLLLVRCFITLFVLVESCPRS